MIKESQNLTNSDSQLENNPFLKAPAEIKKQLKILFILSKIEGETAKRIKGLPSRFSTGLLIPPYRVPEFLAAGADLAVDLYKNIYYVAEQV
ncbi:hypothetical protein HYT18_04770 [Candidatus Microgenomates bacterium]|nr:hypothetical protein [Candidatus Microgenomates bacterium]